MPESHTRRCREAGQWPIRRARPWPRVKIGNSQGVRIPKLLLERSNLTDEVEIEAENDRIIIRSARQPRQDWSGAFDAMVERGEDGLIDRDSPLETTWDRSDWRW